MSDAQTPTAEQLAADPALAPLQATPEPRPFQPDWVSAPGDTIDDVLEERGWTPAELADRLGLTRAHVAELLSGEAALTPDVASRLARVLGSSADFWLAREAQHRAALEARTP